MVDEAIREHLATEVLNPARIEAALDKAIAMLRTTENMVPDRNRLTQRLRGVERTLANLTETAAKGGAVPAVLEALNRADAERRALFDELKRGSLKPFSEKGPAGTFRDLRRTLRGYLDDWHAMIQGNVMEARGLLNVVLRERITFTPIVGLDGNPAYELRIPIAFDRLLSRAGIGRRNVAGSIGVPSGIRTRVLALKGPRPRPLDDGDWCACEKTQIVR